MISAYENRNIAHPPVTRSRFLRIYSLIPLFQVQGIENSVYSLNTSTTGKYLPCSSDLCNSQCSGANNRCPYQVDYVSANTSSSGVLMEDVLHLVTEDGLAKAENASIVFGYDYFLKSSR